MGANSKRFTVRCFSRPIESGYMAVCLQPYLVVKGRTSGEAKERMNALLRAYIEDAVADGTADVLMRRRAPLSLYAQYGIACVVHALRRSTETYTTECCVPQHV
jgi:hypothetical protein